jgi:HPt (histidine-containing phosphotransfer) domain-containing protein
MTTIDVEKQKEELAALGVGVAEATARFAGKYELYQKTLRKFAADIAANGIMEPEKARATEAAELQKYVHGLKGVTANLAINKAYQLLVEVEQTIKDGAPDYAKYETLYAYLPDAAKKITVILAEDSEPAAAKARGTNEECLPLLTNLSYFLNAGNAAECEKLLAQLSAKSWPNLDEAVLEKITKAIEGYDYAGALEIIKNV